MESEVNLRRRLLLTAAASSAALAMSPTHAQGINSFPDKPIRLLVPFSAGGGIDLMARITSEKLTQELGQPVVVENKGGGGGVVASRMAANAPADGYTLVFHSVSSAVVNAQVYKDLGYDPIGAFTPVSLVAQFPLVMIVNKDIPAETLREFIALLKANPTKYAYGSSGVGTGIHFASELFRTMAGVEIQHVPYKGTSAAYTDLLGGRIAMQIDGVPPQVQNISAGHVRALGVTTLKRSAALPNVPTLAEAGLPGYDIPFWVGVYAPAATPRSIVEKLSTAIGRSVRDPATAAKFRASGAEPVGSTPEELGQFWKSQMAVYAKIAKDSNIKLDN